MRSISSTEMASLVRIYNFVVFGYSWLASPGIASRVAPSPTIWILAPPLTRSKRRASSILIIPPPVYSHPPKTRGQLTALGMSIVGNSGADRKRLAHILSRAEKKLRKAQWLHGVGSSSENVSLQDVK
ncbi:MAG TPA: hypothetical protein VFV58_19190 [Blastocatellia bacterium]|jgi:hypothetical protein|nr:hypothetical protein [Blastocatellia bacterium]